MTIVRCNQLPRQSNSDNYSSNQERIESHTTHTANAELKIFEIQKNKTRNKIMKTKSPFYE